MSFQQKPQPTEALELAGSWAVLLVECWGEESQPEEPQRVLGAPEQAAQLPPVLRRVERARLQVPDAQRTRVAPRVAARVSSSAQALRLRQPLQLQRPHGSASARAPRGLRRLNSSASSSR